MKRSNRKSALTLILAVMMIAAMAVSAFANTIQITNNDSGNTFSVYQVMTAEVAGTDNDGNTLYTYTVNDAFKGFFAENGNDGGFGLNNQNEITLNGEVLVGDGRTTNDNTTNAAKLATALARYAAANDIDATTTILDTTVTDDLANGFYVVAQTASADVVDKEVASKPILLDLTQGSAEIAAKNDTTTLEKVIVEDKKEVKANNVNIGDDVAYQITTKIPTYEANVDPTSLSFVLKDTFSDGLTYNNDLDISGFTVGTDYTATYENGVLTITFTNDGIYNHQGVSVVATYSAQLNSAAVIDDEDGNPNTVTLTYTNNPEEEDSSKDLEDETTTYTYGFKLHKVDKVAPTENLADAKFTLKNEDGEYAVFDVSDDGLTYTLTGYTSNTAEATEIVSVDSAQVEIKGLDTGNYTLTETQAPDSYTKLAEPVTVTIADQGELAGGEDAKPNGVAVISAGGAGNATTEGGSSIEDEDGNVTGSVETNDGSIDLAVYVENAKGISLPETGATSALVCMIGGALIVLIGLLYYVFAVRKSKKTNR